MYSKILSATTVALAATLVSAQTHTDCDPTKTSCKPDPALGGTVSVDFRQGASDFFTVADGTKLTYDKDLGAVFTINTVNDAPTITSNKYIFFGKIDVVVRASLGTGVVTSFVLQSDDLDEIDWEWLGGDSAQVQTNYFGKGCTTTYDRGGYSKVADPQHNFDTYTIDWTPTSLTWSINGAVVRTLNAADASGCDSYPQTPMQIKLGTWVAGKPDNPQGTIQWAGGVTDFSQAPFVGYYQSITVTDYSNGAKGATEYVYGDKSGSYQSIQVVTGGNTTSDLTSSSSSSASSSATTSASASKSSGSATTSAVTTLSTATTIGTFTNSTTTSAGGSSGSPTTTATTTSGTTSPSTAPKSAAGKVTSSLAGIAALFMAVLVL